MDSVKREICRLHADNRGATAIEYGLIAAMIAVTLIGAFGLLGASNQGSWASTANKATNVMTTP